MTRHTLNFFLGSIFLFSLGFFFFVYRNENRRELFLWQPIGQRDGRTDGRTYGFTCCISISSQAIEGVQHTADWGGSAIVVLKMPQ